MKRTRTKITGSRKPNKGLFWALLLLSFLSLLAYRLLFFFPVWFDEIVAKAVIFGFPFLLYVLLSRRSVTAFGINPRRFWLGIYLGLALGGSFGFLAMLASAIKTGGHT